jgi:hypothetical protein
MNHRNAWLIAAEELSYTLIYEAAFVPCRYLGDLPVSRSVSSPMAWGYLYQGSPHLLAIVGPQKYLAATARRSLHKL